MTKLEQLLAQKQVILDMQKTNTEEINNLQIVQKKHMVMYNFKLIKEKDNIITLEKELLSKIKYFLYLDLADPNTVYFQREGQTNISGFKIQSIREFDDLLLFINLV